MSTIAISWRHRITIISLVLYWLLIFIFAHIPIPLYVRRAGVSDKCLHFLAYLILSFLLWFAIRPNEKVNWRKAAVWGVFIIVTGYGAIDEVVQSYVGRTCDAMDIAANVLGTLTGLFLFSFFPFWPSALFVASIVIFGVTNLLRANLSELLPIPNTIFHIFAFTIISVLWIQNMHLLNRKTPDKKWLIQALAVPAGFLIMVKLFSVLLGRYFTAQEIIASIGAIIAVIAVVYLIALLRKTSVF